LRRTDIHNFHRRGRPLIDHIDADIAFPIRTVPFHRSSTFAGTSGLRSNPTLQDLLDSLGSKRHDFRSATHELKRDLKEKIVMICRELLDLLQMEKTFGLTPVATVNESWSYLNCSYTHPWSPPDDGRPVGVDNPIASEKHVLTVLWSIKGLLVIEWLGRGDVFNTAYFCDVAIAKLVETSYPGGAVPRRQKFSLNLDNARS
jgi:hypothetical protein